ncbi:MAG: hemerythrin domain-containing protein [Gammaproteobacteria bacterium]|nr:hemerythrin domain-containing protein [Gammaproteobacteria bacterium]
MNDLLNNEAAPDFNDPLGLLKACHQRILGFCDLLEKTVSHIQAKGLDDDAKQAIKKIHYYFSTAAILHHLDEEQDLFPLVIGESLKIATIIHDLKQDHVKLNNAWDDIEPLLAKPASIEGTNNFNDLVDLFCTAYREHVAKENEGFLSMVQHILSTEQLQTLGKKMQERRQPKV